MSLTERETPLTSPAKDGLPEGWAVTTLGDICFQPQYGWTTSAEKRAGGIKLLRTTDISSGLINWATVPECKTPPDDVDKYLLSEGDIVISRAGSVGVNYLLGQCPKAVFASYLIRVRPYPPINSRFLSAFFKSPAYWNAISDNTAGIAIPNINGSKLKDLEIPLPPLAEQHRIAERVEQLLVATSTTRARLARVPLLLKRFRQAVLAAACSGRLTADWREQNQDVEPAERLLERILAERRAKWEAGQRSKKRVKVATGQQSNGLDPFSGKEGVTDVTDAVLSDYKGPAAPDMSELPELPGTWAYASIRVIADCLDNVRVPVNSAERSKRVGIIPYYGANGQVGWIDQSLFDENLVLVVEDETFVGREKPFSYIIRGKTWVNNHAHVLRPVGGIGVEMLNMLLSFYDFVPLTSGTTGRRKLNQASLLNAPVAVPPLAEQQEIVRRVERLFGLADTIEKRTAAAAARADRLTQSILARACRGELVPTEADLARAEGRDYEPASVLLERVQAEQQARESAAGKRRQNIKKLSSAKEAC